MRQALGDSVLAEAGDHAHELIASEANGQVVWPELGLQRLGDIVQQPVAGGVTTPVVDDLERIDVDERDDQRLTAAPGPAQVTLKLQQTGPTQVGPGELIQGGRPSICGRVTAVVQSMSAVQDRGSACIIASPTIIKRGFPVLLGSAAVRAAVSAVPSGRSAVGPSRPAGGRSSRTVLPVVLAVGRGRPPGHHEPLELGPPDSPDARWPLSLLSRAVPHLSGVIARGASLVPKCCREVSFSPVPVPNGSDHVAFGGVDVSFPGAVIALLGHTITT